MKIDATAVLNKAAEWLPAWKIAVHSVYGGCLAWGCQFLSVIFSLFVFRVGCGI